MNRREVTFLLVAVVLAAVFGGVVGEAVGSFLPEGVVKTLFVKHLQIGIGSNVYADVRDNADPHALKQKESDADDGKKKSEPKRYFPLTIDLFGITLTFGLLIKINFVSVLFVLLVFVYFRWWFL